MQVQNSSKSSAATGFFTSNVTTRRPPKQTSKMALPEVGKPSGSTTADSVGSLLMDSILSQSEEDEVYQMLETEGRTFLEPEPLTSTQMGGSLYKEKPTVNVTDYEQGL